MTDVIEKAIEVPSKAGARPRDNDTAVLAEAARAFAKMAVAQHATVLDGASEQEFGDDVLSVLPVWDEDGMELAQAMNRRHSYPLESALVEMMAAWSGFLSEAHRGHVRAWVRDTAPDAPFEDVARVTIKDHRRGEPLAGAAYRTPGGDECATCYVVPDGERDRFIRDAGFAGGRVMSWEDVTVTGPGTEQDILAFRAMHSAEARQARNRAYQSFAYDRSRGFDDAVKQATSLLAKWPPDDVRSGLDKAVAELAGTLAGPGFDPGSESVVSLVAALSVLRSQATRDVFEALPPSP